MKKIFLYVLLFNLSFTAYSVSVTREISQTTIGNKQSAVVTIKISKSGIDGIAKLVEEIPKGFRAFVTKKGGGKVLLGENGELKIVWLTLPVTDKVEIEYRLIHLGSSVGTSKIKGNFTFISGEAKQEQSISPSTITVEEGFVQAEEKTVSDAPISAVYKVQLGVFSAEKELSVFKDLPEVHFTIVNGFYKYFSGKFNSEEEARKIIPQAKAKGFKGAFLVRVKK